MVDFAERVRRMDSFFEFNSLHTLDALAVAVLVAVWFGLGWRIEHPATKRPSVTLLMSQYRREWMQVMVARPTRMFDSLIMGNLRQASSFFASTCVLGVGGVMAMIGNVEPLRGVANEITHDAGPAEVLQIKLALVLLPLSNAFLKFVWSNRLFGYCSVMLGAVPNDPDHPRARPMAEMAAELNVRAAISFNRGLRAMYVSLAGVAWLAGPLPLLAAALVTAWVIWSREFISLPRAMMMNDKPERDTNP